jgi:hypothetical protein
MVYVSNGKYGKLGVLYNVTDSAIVIAKTKGGKFPSNIDTITFDRISRIRIWKWGKGANGFLIGCGLSLAVGILAATEESDPEEKLFDKVRGIAYMPVVGGVGAAIARSNDPVLLISMDYVAFKSYREFLNERCYLKLLEEAGKDKKK